MRIQVWMPWFHWGLIDGKLSQDLQRSLMAYKDEDRMWALRDLKTKTRWRSDDLRSYAAIPATEDNFFTIVNIDHNRHVLTPDLLPEKWEGRVPKSLYLKWLRAKPNIVSNIMRPQASLPLLTKGEMTFRGQEIISEQSELSVNSAMFLMIDSVSPDEKQISVGYPPIDNLNASCTGALSAGADFLSQASPALYQVGDQVLETLIDPRDHLKCALRVSVVWDSPFGELFKDGGGPDVYLHHCAQLQRSVAMVESGDADKIKVAANIAEAWVGSLTRRVLLPWKALECRAHLIKGRGVANFAIEDLRDQGINATSMEDLYSNEAAAIWNEKVEVLRVDSWLGYFWWEFLEDIKTRLRIAHCKLCGEPIPNKNKRRQYCRPDDNPKCATQYEATRKARQRANTAMRLRTDGNVVT